MDEVCPTCGQPLPHERYEANTADEVVAALDARDGRMVYRFNDDSGWGFTNGGRARPAAVMSAVARHLIRPCYSNAPNDAFWLRRTIDVDPTVALRKKSGRRGETVYLPA